MNVNEHDSLPNIWALINPRRIDKPLKSISLHENPHRDYAYAENFS